MLQKLFESLTYKTDLIHMANQVILRFITKGQDHYFIYNTTNNTEEIELFPKTDLIKPENDEAKALLSVVLIGQTINQIEQKVRQEVKKYNQWVEMHNCIVKMLKENFEFSFDEISTHNCFIKKQSLGEEWSGCRSMPWNFEQGILHQIYSMIFLLFEKRTQEVWWNVENLQKVVLGIKEIIKQNKDFCNTPMFDEQMKYRAYHANDLDIKPFWDSMVKVSYEVEKLVNIILQTRIQIPRIGKERLYPFLMLMISPPTIGTWEEYLKERIVSF